MRDHIMRSICRFAWVFGMITLLVDLGCRTTANKEKNGSSDIVEGFIDKDGNLKMTVPEGLNEVVARIRSGLVPSTSPSVDPNKLESFSLATDSRFESTSGIENVGVSCFRNDSNIIKSGWYFWAGLSTGGTEVKSYNSTLVDRCDEMLVTIENLDVTKTYVLTAQFYYRSDDGKIVMVLYEGATDPFRPSDSTIPLRLKKLLIDQDIAVDVEKTKEDQCLLDRNLWVGDRCLNEMSSIMFTHTDLSDYAQPMNENPVTDRKCMQLNSDGSLTQNSCSFKPNQMALPRLHGVQHLSDVSGISSYRWFTFKFESTNTCLTVQPTSAKQTQASMTQVECSEGLPPLNQLFAVVDSKVGDRGGRHAFRIMAIVNKKPFCISVPPEEGDKTGVLPMREGATAYLTPCTPESNTPENPLNAAQRTQYVKFINR